MRAPKKTIENARRLRRALSLPEVLLWNRLRKRGGGLPVFRRQHPIGSYVLDFYCAEACLAVEIDGISHDMADRPQRDLRRDQWLRARGVTVIRISASQFLRNMDETANAIVQMAMGMVEARAPSTALRAVPLPRSAGADSAAPTPKR